MNLNIGKPTNTSTDEVYLYACDLLTLGLLWMCFHDAIREGDDLLEVFITCIQDTW